MYKLDVFVEGAWHNVAKVNAPSRRKAVAMLQKAGEHKDIFTPELFDVPASESRDAYKMTRLTWRVKAA